MRRRAFITLLGGAAVVWPLAARGQQPGRMPLIAVLSGVSDDQTALTRATAFVTRLQDLGWTDGRNMPVSHFMNRFRELGYIDYNGNLEVHSSLLDAVLHEKPPQIKIPK